MHRVKISIREEPYRLMFPLGVGVAVLGVALWPLSIWGLLPFYPGAAHSRLMIGGFFGAMIIGFLGTAGPRLLSVKFLSRIELGIVSILWGGAVAAAGLNRIIVSDVLAILVFAFGFFILLGRFRKRQDLPPPAFAMVALGLLSGFVGTLITLTVSLKADLFANPFQFAQLGKLLYEQALVLLPIFGVAPFFFPRFGGLPNRQASFPEFRVPSKDWSRLAIVAAVSGILLIATFVWEAIGSPKLAGLARALLLCGYLLWQVPIRFPKEKTGTLGRVIQLSSFLLLVGIVLAAFFPMQRIGMLHLVLIGGFNLVTIAVANWVVFGHSGAVARAKSSLPFVRWAVGLIVAAIVVRILGEFYLTARQGLLILAAVLWIAGMLVWALPVLPKVLVADED